MRKFNALLPLMSILTFCYSVKAQHSDNLHKTVIHGGNNSATMPVVNHSHTERTMPQDKPFGIWTGLVTIFKQAITERLPELDKRGLNHGIYLPHGYDYKQWTQEDLSNLATTFNGLEQFELLVTLKNGAGAKEPTDKLSKQDIEDAKKALEYLKPDSCADWQEFGKMIHKIQKQTEARRAELHKQKEGRKSGALLDLNKFSDIAGDPMENPAFDQQAALQTLKDREIVLTDTTSGEKKPLETLVTDAVKSIKGAVRAA